MNGEGPISLLQTENNPCLTLKSNLDKAFNKKALKIQVSSFKCKRFKAATADKFHSLFGSRNYYSKHLKVTGILTLKIRFVLKNPFIS